MPLIRVTVFDGTNVLGAPTKPYADETKVKEVVDTAIGKLNVGAVPMSLTMFNDAKEVGKRSDFEPDDFENLSLREVAACGNYWKLVVHKSRDNLTTPLPSTRPPASSSSGGIPSLPDTLSAMMQQERGKELMLPVRATGG